MTEAAVTTRAPPKRQPLRRRVYAELNPRRRRRGLSIANHFIVAIILISVVCTVAQTEPTIRHPYRLALVVAEYVFASIFAVEYLLRLWTAVEQADYRHPIWGRLRWAATPMALVDLLAWAPTLILPGLAPSQVLRMFRLVRILRLAKLGRMSRAWRLIGEAVAARRLELTLVAAFGAFAVLLSATLLYAAEGPAQPAAFGSIPRALWWEMKLLTGVGRASPSPVTPLGQMLVVLTSITGIALVAAPTGILAAAFSEAFHRHRAERESEKDE